MNDSIFEGNLFGGANNPEAPVGEDLDEAVDVVEDDDESPARGSLLELLAHMKGMLPDGDDDEDTSENDMDADEIHNKAVDYARHGRKREAVNLCMNGLKKFPLDVDLLADTIMYSSEVGDMQTAATHYAILKENVPFYRWNWRAFTFSFDYLLKVDPIANEDECRTIIASYMKYLPYEERACMAKSKLEEALGNAEESMHVLEEAIQTRTNASQCALRLADMQKDRGRFEDVIATATYGIAASAEPQPSINVPYLYFLRALAKDHLLHMKEFRGEPISKEELEDLKEELDLLPKTFPVLIRFASTIKQRVDMLKFVKAV